MELLVRPEEDVLVPELVDADPGLGADHSVDAAHLVSHLPGALETPDVVLAKMISKVPISERETVREERRGEEQEHPQSQSYLLRSGWESTL